ncbi:MAG: hypothetical protein J2P36_14910, partial [Ktedonobacteraceae bacterium]|nr:hypothetical protein [Ktedonobacteraceae bacterium]
MVDSQSHFPSPDEQNFIRALRMILNGTMRRDGQLAEMAGWRAEFLTPGRRLMHAMYEGGPVEFWRTYDLLFPQNDRQEGWKALVAAPHDPFSGNLAAKEHGQEPDGPSGSSSTQHVGPPLAGDSLPTPWAR